MKILISSIFLCAMVLISVSANINLMKLEKESSKCKSEVGVDDEMLMRALDGQMIDDPKFDCFVGCLLGGIGLLDADGSLNTDLAISNVPTSIDHYDTIVAAIRTCGSKKGDDNCSTGHMLFACIHENKIPQLFT